jgi:D-lactate dehydrogenase (cytochrome)
MTTYSQALERIADLVGPKGWIDVQADMASYLSEQRGFYEGVARVVVRPASTGEVAAVLTICHEAGLGVVPQGGNTGLVGGGVADFPNGEGIILSTERLNAIRHVDPLNQTMTVEAGVILSSIQQAADDVEQLFPLSLGAEGSCQIGGNLSTNAGGVQVLRYGNARDLVLGLEVVLADGRIWDGLRALRKDNTGYDLKHLFIGAEGTLGIITAAVLKTFPRPKARATAICAGKDTASIMELFKRARDHLGDGLSTFEIMNRFAFDLATRHIPGNRDPFKAAHGQYALLEATGTGPHVNEALQSLLEASFEDGAIEDAVLAANSTQTREFWRIRETIPESQHFEGGSISNDVSVPVARVEEFLGRATAMFEAEMEGIRICAFGHAGDGNIHFNLSQPVGMDKQEYLDHKKHLNRLIYDLAMDMDGSFSAEHGIGQLKRDDLVRYKSTIELDLMRAMKKTLDPTNIMNPGKII